jgi:hypothetical protein
VVLFRFATLLVVDVFLLAVSARWLGHFLLGPDVDLCLVLGLGRAGWMALPTFWVFLIRTMLVPTVRRGDMQGK